MVCATYVWHITLRKDTQGFDPLIAWNTEGGAHRLEVFHKRIFFQRILPRGDMRNMYPDWPLGDSSVANWSNQLPINCHYTVHSNFFKTINHWTFLLQAEQTQISRKLKRHMLYNNKQFDFGSTQIMSQYTTVTSRDLWICTQRTGIPVSLLDVAASHDTFHTWLSCNRYI